MPTTRQTRVTTAIIVLVLGLQVFADIARSGKWAWPFTDYPMYDASHYEGDRIYAAPVVVGITDDGQEVRISREDLGLNIWQFQRWVSEWSPAYKQLLNYSAGRALVPSLRPWLKSTALFAWLNNGMHEAGDRKSDAVSSTYLAVLATYQRKYGKRLARLRVEDAGVVVTRNGMQSVSPQVIEEVKVTTASQ